MSRTGLKLPISEFFLALIFFLSSWLASWPFTSLPPEYIKNAVIGISFSMILCLRSMTHHNIFSICRGQPLQAILLLVAWSLISGLWVINTANYFYSALLVLSNVFALLVLIEMRNDGLDIWFIIRIIFINSLFLSLLGLAQFYFNLDAYSQNVSPAISFGNKNFAASYILYTLPMGLALLQNAKTAFSKFSYIGILLVCILFIWLSQARASIITSFIMLVMSVAYINFKHANWKKIGLSFVIGTVLFIGIGYLFLPEESISKVFSLSDSKRIQYYLNSIEIISNNILLGVGIGNWPTHHQIYEPLIVIPVRSSHNWLIDFFASLGLPGILCTLYILYKLGKSIVTQLKNKNNLLSAMSALALFSIGLHLLLSPAYRYLSHSLLIVFYLAIVMSNHPKTKQAQSNEGAHIFARYIFTFMVFIIAMTGLWFHVKWIKYENSYWTSVGYVYKNFHKMGESAKIALTHLPLKADAFFYLGVSELKKKNYHESHAALKKFIDSNPWHYQGNLYYFQASSLSNKNLSILKKICEKMLKKYPGDDTFSLLSAAVNKGTRPVLDFS